MQINPQSSAQTEVIRDVPARVLAMLAQGQRVEATVIARMDAETVKLQVGDKVIQLHTRQDLQAGQQVMLERSVESGKPVLKISTSAEIENLLRPAILRQGQQVAVEVVKLLAEQRLLVSPILVNSRQQAVTPQSQLPLARLPAQIEIDISALKQAFRPGDKLALEVLREQPLAVALRPASPSRAEWIQHYQRQLLPQLPREAVRLENLMQMKSALPLPEPVKQALTQLADGLVERQKLQQPEGVRQAVNNSGLFLESRLKNASADPPVKQDLKANLLQLSQVLKTALTSQPTQLRLLDNPEMMQKLPLEVQTALRQLINSPQQMRGLPAQVPPALASQGQTPMQLLLSLLSGLTSTSTTTAPATSVQTSPAHMQTQTGVQAYLQARDNAPSLTQAAVRAMEWQLLRDLLRDVESATARIHFNQLSSLRDPDNPSNVNVWLFDVPVKDKQQLDSLQMRLEQHSPEFSSSEEAIWQVQLNLETQNLGPMQAKISLHQQDVKVVLLAEREHSAQMLGQHIDELNERLDELGINISHLSCRQAVVSALTTDIEQAASGKSLVDISV